jgi:sugar diacid utilization regulator
VTALLSNPLAALVAQYRDESWRVARQVLRGVLELPPDDRCALLATLQAWFDRSGSVERADEALYCHPNTVRYRLQELTGRSMTEPWAVAELATAVQLYTLQRARLDRETPD